MGGPSAEMLEMLEMLLGVCYNFRTLEVEIGYNWNGRTGMVGISAGNYDSCIKS